MLNNLYNFNRIYLVGVGGISMSALCILLKEQGHHVSGQDANKSGRCCELVNKGVFVTKDYNVAEIARSDLVVYSGAIGESDKARVLARNLGIRCMERGELLGIISKNYDNVIAVSGSHGKTTITSMIAYIFYLAGLNPTIHVGGVVPFMKSNIYLGGKKYFITEACEYRDSFLSLNPTVSVVTSVEAEHLDYFATLEREEKSFVKYCQNTTDKCLVSSNAKHFLTVAPNTILTYPNSKQYVKNIYLDQDGKYVFDYVENGEVYNGIKLNVYGKHNVDNALCSIMVARHFGISMGIIKRALSTFTAVESRFEMKTTKDGRKLIYDYAHHPSEIQTTLQTIKDVIKKDCICFFQPHTFSRTKMLFDDFVNVLKRFDSLVLLPTYFARESYNEDGSSYALYKAISRIKTSVYYMKMEDVENFVSSLPKEKVIVFLGAGDVQNLMRKD